MRTVNIIGTTFGNGCEVIKEISSKRKPCGKPERRYIVKCHCGLEWEMAQGHIRNSKVAECFKCGHITRSKTISGSNHWNYRGVLEIDKKRGHAQLKRARKVVLKRDNYKCYITGSTDNLEIHHLESWDSCPELRFNPSNMITLTYNIHRLFHDIYGLGNNTREQFNDFVKTLSI
jgi:5-methylcytosine-specific restriction endonuclease McrA